jgi:hypothetical protein
MREAVLIAPLSFVRSSFPLVGAPPANFSFEIVCHLKQLASDLRLLLCHRAHIARRLTAERGLGSG